ncbi:hypothetical protein [Verrucomicrobium spinosum]|uniref:hypothetical protein n=1 Tax=Verrucomicrobium spinosum TaxID=2736 RepID=UPI000AD247F2|nr:hypothetical protein [Verrucomicrobium spinosum]
MPGWEAHVAAISRPEVASRTWPMTMLTGMSVRLRTCELWLKAEADRASDEPMESRARTRPISKATMESTITSAIPA